MTYKNWMLKIMLNGQSDTNAHSDVSLQIITKDLHPN